MIESETVRSLKTRPPVVVSPDATLREVAEMLTDESIGAIVVRTVHSPSGGVRVEGMVSERDLVRAMAIGLHTERTAVEEIMTLDPATVAPTASVLEVIDIMLENEIRHVPLIDNDVVVGVVSERDALRALRAEHDARAR